MKNRLIFFYINTNFTSISRYPTCYKNPNNPSCIDHILTNSPKSFLKQKLFLQGYQKSMNCFYLYLGYIFQKRRLREISNRNFRDFKEDNFNWDIQNRLSAKFVEEYAPFEKFFVDALNKHAPLKLVHN